MFKKKTKNKNQSESTDSLFTSNSAALVALQNVSTAVGDQQVSLWHNLYRQLQL